jgi:hypothetical protein
MDDARSQLAALQLQRSACLDFVRRLCEWQACVDELLAVAGVGSYPATRPACAAPRTCEPTCAPAARRLHRPTPRWRYVGQPFLSSPDPDAPLAPLYTSPAAAATSAWWATHDPALSTRADSHAWTAGEDALLREAVGRIAIATMIEHAVTSAGLTMPASLRPLGSASRLRLRDAGPRASLQYACSVHLDAVWTAVVQCNPALGASGSAGLRAQLLQALTSSSSDVDAFVQAADSSHGAGGGGGSAAGDLDGRRATAALHGGWPPARKRARVDSEVAQWAVEAGRATAGGFDWGRIVAGGFLPPSAHDVQEWQCRLRWRALMARDSARPWEGHEVAALHAAVACVAGAPPSSARGGVDARGGSRRRGTAPSTAAPGTSFDPTTMGTVDWPAVLALAESTRSPWQACERWVRDCDAEAAGASTGPADHAVLAAAMAEAARVRQSLAAGSSVGASGIDHVALADLVDWEHVQAHLPGRTEAALRDAAVEAGGAAAAADDALAARTRDFTVGEEGRLRLLRAMLGEGDWGSQATAWLPGRTSQQLRSHWSSAMAADTSWLPFSEAEVSWVGGGGGGESVHVTSSHLYADAQDGVLLSTAAAFCRQGKWTAAIGVLAAEVGCTRTITQVRRRWEALQAQRKRQRDSDTLARRAATAAVATAGADGADEHGTSD